MGLHHLFEAENRLRESRALAATIGLKVDICCQHRTKRIHVAAARCIEEGLRQFEPALLIDLKTRTLLAHMLARPCSKLAAGSGIALDCPGYLVEIQPEDIMQQEGRAFQWRKTLQRQHERKGDIVIRFLFDNRIGNPRPEIGFALVATGFQKIKAQAGNSATQKGFRLAHFAAVGVHPSDERLLHHILGIGDRTQHAIGNADQFRAQRIEAVSCIALQGCVSHQTAAFTAGFLASGSNQRPKPTAMRFHPLMMLIISVRFTCSSSVNCACMAVRASSRS